MKIISQDLHVESKQLSLYDTQWPFYFRYCSQLHAVTLVLH